LVVYYTLIQNNIVASVGSFTPGAGKEEWLMKWLWHRLLARLLELLLTNEGVAVLSELPATSNPPRIDVLLLRRAGKRWTARQRARLPDGVRDRSAAHHLLECKITESVTEQSLQQVLTYDYLYRQSQQVALHAVQSYVVSAKTPQAAKLAAWGYTVQEQPGVYVSTLPLLRRVVLLVLNELRDEPHNEYLRLFASRQRVRQSALRRLDPAATSAIWAVVFALQKAYALEGAEMNAEITIDSLLAMGEEMRKQVVASASVAERLAGLEPAERLAGLEPAERLAGLEPAERLAGLEPAERLAGLEPAERLAGLEPAERLAGLGPEELRLLLKQIEVHLQEQS
jgi:hypothetical protein